MPDTDTIFTKHTGTKLPDGNPVRVTLGQGGYWDPDVTITMDGRKSVEPYVVLNLPDTSDAFSLRNGVRIVPHNLRDMRAERAANAAVLLTIASQMAAEYTEQLAGLVEKAQKAAEEQERREREQAAKEEAEWERRKEQLMMEFDGEQGRIRLRGLKRWRPVSVKVEEYGEDDYRPVFYYKLEKHGYRESFGRHIAQFQIKRGSRYANVWGDDSDLHPLDRSPERTARPWQG